MSNIFLFVFLARSLFLFVIDYGSVLTHLTDVCRISAKVNDPHSASIFSLYLVTWNVSQKYPDNITLDDLLGIDSNAEDKRLHDVYIIGLQEVNANPQNVVSNFFKSDPWVQKMKDFLKPLEYIVAKTEQMQGLLLTIFVKRKHFYHIREVEGEFTRTGFGGMWVS